jgi:pimeloyl-ACP methyl ester carboxylesterase
MAHDNSISGSFGKKRIYYQYLESQTVTDIVVVFCHGVFSNSYNNQKYQRLAEEIVSASLGNVLLFESSRTTQSWEKGDSWEEYRNSFTGKTFEDERLDLFKIVDFIDTQTHGKKKFVLIGSSLGGTLASFLLPLYKEKILGVVLLGSGITTKSPEQPILSTYPAKKIVLENYRHFMGFVTLVQGTLDTVVPRKEAQRIVTQKSPSPRRDLIILQGVDHTFSTINRKPEPEKIHTLLFDILKTFLSRI